ncbi:hypothetical protein TRFO_33116 [Tritrichomonas foetus]|uniref:Uncharacterized protein n=1 Tax=Tritrichomonas foetus TaxID=1144522 RepID=A0A1J4JNG1_9EUKA|nr:hypothetical protein TRFO_33116 [Tritrichomonas foetus]|eukprot:OHT00242.1 hypothetical protein TRFO_33116 [Tritrichomonas foetus]
MYLFKIVINFKFCSKILFSYQLFDNILMLSIYNKICFHNNGNVLIHKILSMLGKVEKRLDEKKYFEKLEKGRKKNLLKNNLTHRTFIFFIYRTPLHFASHKNRALAARLLLTDGADPHSFDKNGFTPLHSACEHGSNDFIQVLLEFNAKPDITFRKGIFTRKFIGHPSILLFNINNYKLFNYFLIIKPM